MPLAAGADSPQDALNMMAPPIPGAKRAIEPPPFLPTGIDDPRLKNNNGYRTTPALELMAKKSRYSHELLRYAQKLSDKGKYKDALAIVEKASKEGPEISFDEDRDMHLTLCLKLGSISSGEQKKHYYDLAIADCDKGINGWHGLDYYLFKVRALLGLGLKQQAIDCCEAGYRRAQSESKAVDKFSKCLKELSGADKPIADNEKSRVEEIHRDIVQLTQCAVCPTQAELEKRFGRPFVVSWPDVPHMIRRDMPNPSKLYNSARLSIPHKITGPSALYLEQPDGFITEELVRQWLAPNVPVKEESTYTNSLVYEYPWGELDIAFSPFHSKAAYALAFRWFKSSECDGLVDHFEGPQPTFEQRLQTIDGALDKKDFHKAFLEIDRLSVESTLFDRFPPKEERDAIRRRIIRLKELENKPDIVAYLREASFQEIAKITYLIDCGHKRDDYPTPKEAAAQKYWLMGKLSKDYSGQLEIIGFEGERIATITEQTEAAQKFLDSLKVTLPCDLTGEHSVSLSPLPAALIDQIAEEQEAIIQTRVAERKALIKAKYDEGSKNPLIVKERERQARRNLLDPTRSIMQDAWSNSIIRMK